MRVPSAPTVTGQHLRHAGDAAGAGVVEPNEAAVRVQAVRVAVITLFDSELIFILE